MTSAQADGLLMLYAAGVAALEHLVVLVGVWVLADIALGVVSVFGREREQ